MNDFLDFARDLAEKSGALIGRYYRQPVKVERKADLTPVTIADREAEALMREMIGRKYPDHQVMGEEAGLSGPENARFQWMLDPIDGTKSFVHGSPLFGTLIALLDDGKPVLGAMHFPVTGDFLVGADGINTTWNGNPVGVSSETSLEKATLLYTDPVEMKRQGYGPAFEKLSAQAELVRTWGDCYGHFLVATGRAEIMFDPIMSPWDIAALRPCVEGAGGKLTDRDGQLLPLGESALSTNGHLHTQVLEILNQK